MKSKVHSRFIRRIVAIVIAASLLVFTPVPAPIATSLQDVGIETSIDAEAETIRSTTVTVYVVTTTAGLNVRSGPGTNYKKVDKLKGGTIFKSYNSKNGWLQIAAGKWVCRDYCGKCSSYTDLNYDIRHRVIVKTNGANLNLRSGPSESFGLVVKIPNGTRLNPYYKYNGWCFITYKSYSGWVSMKYIKDVY